MEHLRPESLARLVAEAPSPEEARHLKACARCRAELEALREQTEDLADLADLRPPAGGWEPIEERLAAEGLLVPERRAFRRTPGDAADAGGGRRGWTPARAGGTGWASLLRAAAVAGLLLAGGGLGAAGATLLGPAGPEAPGNDEMPMPDPAVALEAASLEEAEEMVRLSEEWYHASLVRYRELEGSSGDAAPDPVTRFAAIETLMAAGRAAVRESPTDPFLNGLLLNVHAEREMALRGLQARPADRDWY